MPLSRTLLLLLLSSVFAPAAVPVKKTAPASPTHAPAQKTPQERDERRAELLGIIEAEQKVIDRYDRQSGFKKKDDFFWVTEAQYKAAKARRDAAQKERDALANG